MKKQNYRQLCPRWTRASQPEGHSKRQGPGAIGSTPIYEDWTPDVPGLDPRYTRIGTLMYEDWTPDVQGHKTQHPLDENPGLRGIQDFVGFRTSWDSNFVGFRTSWDPGLRGIQDFVGPRTSWDLGLRRKQDVTHIRSESCSVVFSKENTNFQDKFITWTPLGIRLVDSVISLCFIFMALRCTDNAH